MIEQLKLLFGIVMIFGLLIWSFAYLQIKDYIRKNQRFKKDLREYYGIIPEIDFIFILYLFFKKRRGLDNFLLKTIRIGRVGLIISIVSIISIGITDLLK